MDLAFELVGGALCGGAVGAVSGGALGGTAGFVADCVEYGDGAWTMRGAGYGFQTGFYIGVFKGTGWVESDHLEAKAKMKEQEL